VFTFIVHRDKITAIDMIADARCDAHLLPVGRRFVAAQQSEIVELVECPVSPACPAPRLSAG
jgi:hypothetical protein